MKRLVHCDEFEKQPLQIIGICENLTVADGFIHQLPHTREPARRETCCRRLKKDERQYKAAAPSGLDKSAFSKNLAKTCTALGLLT